MKKSLILILVVLAMVSIVVAPVFATILFEDDFAVNGSLDSSKWFFVTDYVAQGGFATPSDSGGKMYSSDSFGGLGSGQLTVEFLGVQLKHYVAPATQYSNNWFGMFDLSDSNWFVTGTGFMIDWAADLAACPNRELSGTTWTPIQLDPTKSYDMRMLYTPGGNIDMYCNEAGASTWNLVCNAPVSPTQALKIETYAEDGYYFDKIVVSTPPPPAFATVLFEDDFAVKGPLNPSKWSLGANYYAQQGYATATADGAKLVSSLSFGGSGSGQIAIEFLGVKVNSAVNEGNNWFGLWDLGSNWFATGTGFRVDNGTNELVAFPNNALYSPTWSGIYLDPTKSYDMRIIYTLGGNIDMYCNESGAAEWGWVRNAPIGPTEALKIETYEDTQRINFDRIVVSTPPAPSPSLSGTVDLSDYDGDITAIPVIVIMNGTTYTTNLDVDGKFTISDITNGNYDVRIKATHWLAKVTSGVEVAGSTVMDPVSLINGDVVDNNEVDFDDINTVRAAYGSFPGDETWNEMADVDGSGEVDFTDINIVRSKYGEIGD